MAITPLAVSDVTSMPLSMRLSQPINQISKVQKSESTAKELISPDRLTQLFTKSCSHRNFTVNLVRELLTTEVWLMLLVEGRSLMKLKWNM